MFVLFFYERLTSVLMHLPFKKKKTVLQNKCLTYVARLQVQDWGCVILGYPRLEIVTTGKYTYVFTYMCEYPHNNFKRTL